ncbi:39S ribosomal protein L28, mitochondrial [Ischnura elegans]|uniref:39S ribosomal protein L28, mitochondrial n=1 Tax=Ischnura elegans TaxID=197161 RepID=UPI001ED86796|nr:39S ribosomal protein L28, mitochondrial [Ischnura elegans]
MESKAIQVLAWKATKNIVNYCDDLPKRLPLAYKKFWNEWKVKEPTAVHWIPRTERWKRDPETGEMSLVQNAPIPVLYPNQHNHGIWGGEGVVKGFQKRKPTIRRVAHYWFPLLKRSVVYSEILNKHIAVIVTDRTLRLINENNGFDFYLLKTPACDLKSDLALKIKRKLLLALLDKSFYSEDEERKEEVFNKYKNYMLPREEAEWYGLSYKEALAKLIREEVEDSKPKPLKIQFRMELLERLKEEKEEIPSLPEEKSSSWVSKINPFSSKSDQPST